MSAIVKLGNLEFNPQQTPIAPIQRTRSHNFAEHSKLEGKPSLQRVGGKLDTLTLEITLHPSLCDPAEKLAELRQLFEAAEERELYIGDNYEGQWVIEELKEEPDNLLKNEDEWLWTSGKVTLKLKEYVPRNEIAFSGLGNLLGSFPVFR